MNQKRILQNAAVAVLRRRGIGPSEMARRVGCPKSAASSYLDGTYKPDAERRAVIERELDVAAADWDRAAEPIKNSRARIKNSAAASPNAPSEAGIIFNAEEQLPPEASTWPSSLQALARLRLVRRRAEAEGQWPALLRLAGSELRAVRELYDVAEHGRVRRQLVEHMLGWLLAADAPAHDRVVEVLVAAGELVVDDGPERLLSEDDDPAPDAVRWGDSAPTIAVAAMRLRLARWRGRASGADLNTISKLEELERRAVSLQRKIVGDVEALRQTEEWAALRWRTIQIFEHSPEGLRFWLERVAPSTADEVRVGDAGPLDVVMNRRCSHPCCNPVLTAEQILAHRRSFAAGGRVVWVDGPPCPRVGAGGVLLADAELPEPLRSRFIADSRRQAAEHRRLDALDRASGAAA